MASLMENLIHILEEECKVYEELLALSTRKTPVVIKGDLEQLEKITDEEQVIVSRVNHLDNQREEALKDIAIVINKDVETLKLKNLIQVLEKRPEEQKRLSKCHDRISELLDDLKRVNEQNNVLIQNALEMVTFDINLVQALNSAPETANYSKNANRTVGNMYQDPYASGGFDAKQ
jgi:flagellar biosynthesis/type III secretory pathway chaperone